MVGLIFVSLGSINQGPSIWIVFYLQMQPQKHPPPFYYIILCRPKSVNPGKKAASSHAFGPSLYVTINSEIPVTNSAQDYITIYSGATSLTAAANARSDRYLLTIFSNKNLSFLLHASIYFSDGVVDF